MTKTIGIMLGTALLASCAVDEPVEAYVSLDSRSALIRASTDLRAVHPTEEELLAIEANPDLYGAFVDRYLDDPRFLERLREIFNHRYLTRDGSSYAEEPLRLLTHIVANDLPYSEIVTAEYTVADAALAEMFDIDVPVGAADIEGWAAGWYQDGRPHAGVLTQTSLWLRYPSAGGNANRHRANAVSKLLLCDDYLDRPIAFTRNAVDQVTVDPEQAIRDSASCQSCHATLDPMAAHFFGFFGYDEDDEENIYDPTVYRPENETQWRDYADRAPGWYGTPTSNLVELGEQVAADPRFVDCAVQTVWEGLTQRTYEDGDWAEFQARRAEFTESGLDVKTLARAVVTSDAYLAAEVVDPVVAARLPTVRTASPAQIAGIIEGITDYRWTFDGADGLTSPTFGLKPLAGGVDGRSASRVARAPSVGTVFVQERLAQAAAYHVVTHDLARDRAGDAVLLGSVNIDDRPDVSQEAFHGQIRALYLAATGRPLPEDAPEPSALTALWQQIYSVDASPTDAWAGVVSAVLRDPAVLFY
jgi:hypothetical protein